MVKSFKPKIKKFSQASTATRGQLVSNIGIIILPRFLTRLERFFIETESWPHLNDIVQPFHRFI